MTEELKRIFPGEDYTLQNGEVVRVSPVPFGKLLAFGEALASLFTKIQGTNFTDPDNGTEILGKVFQEAFDEIIALMGLVLGKEREWFDFITVEDGIGLLTLILKQNFNESTKKKLDQLLPRMQSIST